VIPGRRLEASALLRTLRRRPLRFLVPAVLIAAGAAALVARIPDRYRSETLILVVPQRVPETYIQSTVTARIEDRLQTITQQILSRSKLEPLIRELKLYPDERRLLPMDDVVERMRTDVDVRLVNGDAFRISYVSRDADAARQVTERLASLFIEENLRDREVLAEGTDQFLEAQLADARQRLMEHEKKLEEYRRRYSGQLPSQVDINLQIIQNAQLRAQSLMESVNRDRDRRAVLERLIADVAASRRADVAAPQKVLPVQPDAPDAAVAGASTATPEQLEQARASLRGLESRMKPTHPDVRYAKRVIATLEAKLAAEPPAPADHREPAEPAVNAVIDRRVAEMRAEIESLDRQIGFKQQEEQRTRDTIASYEARIQAVPARESELIDLTRDYNTLQTVYQQLLAKKENSKVAANLERRQIGEQFKVLDPARRPERPVSPNRPLFYTLSLLGGVFVAGALLTGSVWRNASFASDEDVRLALALPVLAVVPRVSTARERRRRRLRRWLAAAAVTVGSAGAGAALLAWMR
jgi:polysaccharide chain length determinant protein (PEP-CTERM system associated)